MRVAGVNDALAIARVNVRAWQRAYVGHMPQEYLDALDPVTAAERWRRSLSLLAENAHVFVVEEASVVGFASCRPSRDDDGAGTGEVTTIYVLPEHWGTGLGPALMSAVLEALTADGFPAATLWVLEGNERARRFYERGGWRPDGASRVDERFGFPIAEVRYRRELSEPSR